MRIAIDARELAGHPTGVGRYLAEIVREWGTLPEALPHEYVFCAPADMPYDGPLRARVIVDGGAGCGAGTLWEQRVLRRLAARSGADVLFCPGYAGPVFARPPMVVAVHDVSFAAHPEWFSWREGLRRRIITRAAARRAAQVLTLTDFSRREIVEHLGVPADRVTVVRPGVVPQPAAVAATSPSLLYVGSIFNRRHVPETIRAFERLARRRPDATFTIVGDNRTFPRIDLDRLVRAAGRVQLRSYVAEAVLRDLYQRARAFVFLSEYEGFGLTPLEALSAGIPAVVLDTPVAREVYGDAALYVSAPDPRVIERALELALFDEDARAQVLARAPAVVARYSWTACARQVLAALEEAGT